MKYLLVIFIMNAMGTPAFEFNDRESCAIAAQAVMAVVSDGRAVCAMVVSEQARGPIKR